MQIEILNHEPKLAALKHAIAVLRKLYFSTPVCEGEEHVHALAQLTVLQDEIEIAAELAAATKARAEERVTVL